MSEKRTITIGSLYRSSRTQTGQRVPYIRLSGHWLEKLGFPCGARLVIAPEETKLVITLAPAELDEKAKTDSNHRGRKPPRPQRRMPHLAIALLRRRTASPRSSVSSEPASSNQQGVPVTCC
jgi:hypothetical protein